MNNVDYIVVHCSDSPHGRGDDIETIRRWHKERGWADVGYHYVITEQGEVQKGREESVRGAHVKAHNHHSIGICLIGREEFTNKQKTALKYLLMQLKLRYKRSLVVSHRDLDSSKTCPNFDAARFWEEELWEFIDGGY